MTEGFMQRLGDVFVCKWKKSANTYKNRSANGKGHGLKASKSCCRPLHAQLICLQPVAPIIHAFPTKSGIRPSINGMEPLKPYLIHKVFKIAAWTYLDPWQRC
eukprot:1157667-Pelagomonas_calceolata.AAC.5